MECGFRDTIKKINIRYLPRNAEIRSFLGLFGLKAKALYTRSDRALSRSFSFQTEMGIKSKHSIYSTLCFKRLTQPSSVAFMMKLSTAAAFSRTVNFFLALSSPLSTSIVLFWVSFLLLGA